MSDKKLVQIASYNEVTDALSTELNNGQNVTRTDAAHSSNGLALEALRRSLYVITSLGFVIAKPEGSDE